MNVDDNGPELKYWWIIYIITAPLTGFIICDLWYALGMYEVVEQLSFGIKRIINYMCFDFR